MIELFPTRHIALTIGSFSIHWYGLLYLVAFIQAYLLLPRLQRLVGLSFTREQWQEIVALGAAAVVVGGRLGYVLFYEPAYFFAHPLEIFALWQGGMSSHGGFIAVIVALSLFARRKGIETWRLLDIIVIVVALGLALGRLGNFINYELFGPPTALPWAVTIPGEAVARHPTPLYAVGKNVLIAALTYSYLRWGKNARVGETAALFVALYGLLRFLVEYLRVQEWPYFNAGPISLTYGQLLTLPLLLGGVAYFLWRRKVGQPYQRP